MLLWKPMSSPYAQANKDVLVEEYRAIGPTVSAITSMLANMDEQKEYMPAVLGVSASSSDWNARIAHYWNSISIDIPSSGKILEIGFDYDVDSVSKRDYVISFNRSGKGKKIETDEDAHAYFQTELNTINKSFEDGLAGARKIGNLRDQDKVVAALYKKKYDAIIKLEGHKYKFGTPINLDDYMLYRLCLLHAHVANDYSLADKSNNIRFYLHSEEEIKAQKEQQIRIEKERMEAFLDVVKSQDKVENVLYAMGYGSFMNGTDVSDRNIKLNEISLENPTKFVRTVSNPALNTIGQIEKYITFGILNRLPNSQIIVDANNPDLIIGNTIQEAITFFKLETNKGIVSEYKVRYEGLPKK
jgi:hypothetical protein